MEWDKRASDSLKVINKSVIPVLFRQFYNKGLVPIEIKRITRDILNIFGNGGFYNAGILNRSWNVWGGGKISWITIFLS